jgi:aminopeptidase N
VTACAHSSDPYLPGSGDDRFGVDHYDLTITYRPASNRLDGEARIAATVLDETRDVCLDLAGLAVDKVTVDGKRAAKYRHRKGKLHITLPGPKRAGEPLALVVTYSGQPQPVSGVWGDVGWEELSEGALVAGQPNGAPSWFPCNDRPSDKATYRIGVTCDSPFTVIANGALVERRAGASTTTWRFEQPEPMATYLATVQIGHYDLREIETTTPRQLIARPARLAAATRREFARQGEMMRCFEELFGPYPFGAYTVVVTDDPLEIPLEAQGMSTFGANQVDGRRGQERLVAHELAHQWFGNSLTIERWSDIWLNEGFACYAEWLWSERSGGPSAQACAQRYWKRLRDADQDLLLVDPGPESMFDDRVYKRGALALHAVRGALGSDAFFGWLRSWVADHRHGTVSTAAFRDHLAAHADVSEVVSRWLDRPEVPSLPTVSGDRAS